MAARLFELMRRIYSACPMMLASEDVRPGMLLRTVWGPPAQGRPEKFIGEIDYAWRLVDGACTTASQSDLFSESIIVGEVSDDVKVDVNLALPQFGFCAGASFPEEKAAELTVGEIKVRCFKNPFAKYDLRQKLRGLKEANQRRYVWADSGFLVSEAYYAGGLRFEFKKEDGFDPKTAYAGMRVADGFAASWRDDMTLVLEGTARVPFAVAGIKI